MIGFYINDTNLKGDKQICLAVPFIGTKNEIIYNKAVYVIDSEMFLVYRESGNPINKIIINTIENGNETGSLPASGYDFYLEINVIYPGFNKVQKKELMDALRSESGLQRNIMFLYTNNNIKERFQFSLDKNTGEIKNRRYHLQDEKG